MKKVLFVATVSSHIKAFHIPYLKHFQELGWETHVACNVATGYENSASEIQNTVTIPHCDYFHNLPFQRSPLSKDNLSAYKQLKKIMDEHHFDIVHCHTPVGGAIGRLAARASRKCGTRVFYTAHGFHFYKGAPLKNWIIYYPIEKWLSRYTDCLITINKEDFEKAKKKLSAKNTIYVPGVGIDLAKFYSAEPRDAIREKLGISKNDFLILSVGELNENKNHEVIIRALKEINLSNVHYVLAGTGPLREHLMSLTEELDLAEQIHFLGFRTDVPRLYHVADLFVHPSFREGLPVAVMEAMASGLSVVASEIRGNHDLITPQGGALCAPSNIESFAKEIKVRIDDPLKKSYEGEFNSNSAQKFSIDHVLYTVSQLYFKP